MGAKYTEAQAAAAKRYRESKAEFKVVTSKEDKQTYQAAAASVGKSLNQFTIDALNAECERIKK